MVNLGLVGGEQGVIFNSHCPVVHLIAEHLQFLIAGLPDDYLHALACTLRTSGLSNILSASKLVH